MRKYWISQVLAGVSLVILVVFFALSLQQRQLADKLVRLHVIANSDSEIDQAVKLQVRDGVLAVTAGLEPGDKNQAVSQLSQALPQIEQAANQVLLDLGSPYHATATLTREAYPTREYDTFTLPAGMYDSLQVTIGEGAGHNWWCVVYPALCTPATAGEFEVAALDAGLSQQEITIVEEQDITLKFQILEWWSAWFG